MTTTPAQPPAETPTVATALINLSMYIATVPEPWRSQLIARHTQLSDAILAHLAIMMERDKAILGLVEQTRTDSQYIAFDLEATRRERDQLQDRVNSILGENLPEEFGIEPPEIDDSQDDFRNNPDEGDPDDSELQE